MDPSLKAEKPKATFDQSSGAVKWSMNILNGGDQYIPPNVMEFRVFQSASGIQPRLMQTELLNTQMGLSQMQILLGEFLPCCSYNKIMVEIPNRISGKIITSSTGDIPISPARAAIKIREVYKHIDTKKGINNLCVGMENLSPMPIRVFTMIYRTTDGESTLLKQESVVAPGSKLKSYCSKLPVGGFDTVRIEAWQEAPPVCPVTNCVTYANWEGVVNIKMPFP